MGKNFVNMHKHSWYSNSITPDSPVSPQDYVSRILELGQTVLSGVEHGSPYAQNVYYDLAKENNLKFLFGVEAYMVKDRFAEIDGKRDSTNGHILLLAKNDNGRKAINKIISQANIDGFYYKPRIDWDLFISLPNNDVWATTSCAGGFFWKYGDNTDVLILQAREHFGQNFFLEVQNHLVTEQIELNKRIINLSNRYNIPIVFGLDSHFIYPEQAKDRDDFLRSRGISYPEEENWFMDFPNYDEVKARFLKQGALTSHQIDEAIENTLIFENVEEYNSEVYQNNVKLPTLYPNKTQKERNQIFVNLINEKWNETKKNIPPYDWDLYEKEINNEVSTVVETNMSDYFLIDYEIIKKGIENGGHMTLTGRGSGVSYLISKLLGLTTIDRISAEVKLFPERFITKERILEAGTLPDFDFNVGNPEVFAKAQKEVLGDDNSYPMIAYGTAKPKAAWKLYARSQGIEFDIANAISGEIEKYEMAIKHAEDEEEREQIDIVSYISPEYRDMFIESIKYQGIINDIKPHPCGYLLFDKPISEEIGLVRCNDVVCVNMDGAWAEKNKFVKNDLLKVSVVELIHRVYNRIGIEPHQLPDLIEICKDDEKVWEVYKNAWVMGINQIEGSSARGLISDYAPRNIAEVSAFVAAIRPGFKSYYKQFQSREPFEFGIKSIDKILQTPDFPYSYMLYQENAMQIMQYAGIPISETYEVIKNIAKKRAEKVYKYKEIFLSGMKTKLMEVDKIDEARAEKVSADMWQVIEDSAHYSFNASHAYSVAGDSLYGAYLKSHYPLEFYETLLNICEEDGDKDRLVATKEEARKAYRINFPPYRFGQDNRAIVMDKENWAITSSLKSIKGFSSKSGDDMWELSQHSFNDFLDLLVYAEENKLLYSYFEKLIMINYFEKFGRNMKLLQLYKAFTDGKIKYLRTYVDATKEKRLQALKEYAETLDNRTLSILSQIEVELEILGYIQSQYNIPKDYLFVQSLDLQYAPRINVYCLASGKVNSLKIRKKIYEQTPFNAGEIIKVNMARDNMGRLIHLRKEPRKKFINGQFVDDENEYDWWLSSYTVISPEEFDKIIAQSIDK